MDHMTKVIREVTEAANDGAQGTASIAKETESMTHYSGAVSQEAQTASISSQALMEAVGKFTV
ncbi:hypothetical protein D3C73_1544230 [compost metagenome]